MNEPSHEIEKQLQELKCKKSQLQKVLSELVKSKEDDDKTVMKIYEISIKLDDIGDDIRRLEKEKSLDDER